MKYLHRFRNYLRSDRAGAFYASVTAASLLLCIGLLLLATASPPTRPAVPDAPQAATGSTAQPQDPALPGQQRLRATGGVELTDAEASVLLGAALRRTLNVDNVAVSFTAPETLRVEATVPRDTVRVVMEQSGVPFVNSLVKLLPDSIALSVEAAVSASDGELRVTPTGVSTGGIDVTEFLPRSIADAAADALAGAVGSYVTIDDVEVRDGSVTIYIGE